LQPFLDILNKTYLFLDDAKHDQRPDPELGRGRPFVHRLLRPLHGHRLRTQLLALRPHVVSGELPWFHYPYSLTHKFIDTHPHGIVPFVGEMGLNVNKKMRLLDLVMNKNQCNKN
jgi:hypothetical protein